MHTKTATAVSELDVAYPSDADVDIEVLKDIPKDFYIDTEERANWFIRRVASARQYAQQVKDWADRELRRAAREEQTLMFLFGRQIESWTKDEIGKLSGRRKSLNLPAGSVGFRTTPTRLVVDDENVVITWARSNLPSAIVVVEKLSRTTMNEYAEKTGVIPDAGVHVESQHEKFYIR